MLDGKRPLTKPRQNNEARGGTMIERVKTRPTLNRLPDALFLPKHLRNSDSSTEHWHVHFLRSRLVADFLTQVSKKQLRPVDVVHFLRQRTSRNHSKKISKFA